MQLFNLPNPPYSFAIEYCSIFLSVCCLFQGYDEKDGQTDEAWARLKQVLVNKDDNKNRAWKKTERVFSLDLKISQSSTKRKRAQEFNFILIVLKFLVRFDFIILLFIDSLINMINFTKLGLVFW